MMGEIIRRNDNLGRGNFAHGLYSIYFGLDGVLITGILIRVLSGHTYRPYRFYRYLDPLMFLVEAV